MHLANVEVGKVYYVKVSGKVVPCRVDSLHSDLMVSKRVWCTNLKTGRVIRVSSAKLRFEVRG